jgi:phage tail-like protein
MPRSVLFPDHYFKISLPDIEIGMFRECSGLSMEFDVFEWAEGGNNEFVHHLPGRVRYPYLSLTRGLTNQDALQQWFWQTRQQPDLKEITVELETPTGDTSRAWVFADAFPVRWTGPAVAVHARGMAIESLEIAHSGLKVA